MNQPSSQDRLWWPRFIHLHNRYVVYFLLLTVWFGSWVATLGLPMQVGLLAVFVAATGLPHGSLDLVVMRGMGLRGGRLWVAVFFYLVLTGIVLLSFKVFPVLTLAIFLFTAWAHFGMGDTEALVGGRRFLEATARGGLTIVAPVIFHRAETENLFLKLCGESYAVQVKTLTDILAVNIAPIWWVTVGGAILARLFLKTSRQDNLYAAAEITLTLALFAYWPPLLAFIIYFCAIHSVRHLTELGASRYPHSQQKAFQWLWVESWPITLLTIVGGGLAWVFGHDKVDALLLSIVFQGLAALTAPHMVLSLWWHRRGEPPPGDFLSRSS